MYNLTKKIFKFANVSLKKVFERLGAIFGTQCNPYMVLYKKMHEVEEAHRANSEARGEKWEPNVKMFIGRVRPGQHPGRYNDCQVGEIAAVFTSENDLPPADFSVCVYPRYTGRPKLHELAATNENTDPMCYPLLFPFGDKGMNLTLNFSQILIKATAYLSLRLEHPHEACE